MSGVFLSYASGDGAVAMRVYNDLRRGRLSVWRYERDGEIGVDFVDEIKEQIADCAAFCLLDSPAARRSSHVQFEVALARELAAGRSDTPRFLVGLVHMPGPWQSDEMFAGQSQHRYADLTTYDRGIRELCEAVGVQYVPAFTMPRDEDFAEELFATSIAPHVRQRLLDDYELFRRRYDASKLEEAERKLASLIDDCRELEVRAISPYLALGVLRGDLLRDAEAGETFHEATVIAPDDPRGWAGLGGCCYYLGRYADAAAAYEQCRRRIEASNAPAHRERAAEVAHHLATTLTVLGRIGQARKVLEETAGALEGHAPSLALLGHILMLERQPRAARARLRQALELGVAASAGPGLFLELANCYTQLGDHDEELAVLRRALERHPRDAAVHRRIAVYHAARGELEEAELRLVEALRLRPKLLSARAELALLFRRMGRDPECRAELERCLAVDPRSAEDHYYLGLALHLLGDASGADGERRRSRRDERVARWPDYDDLVANDLIRN